MFFIFFLMVCMSFVNFLVLDYVIWWSVFVICTFLFIFFVGMDNVSCVINYYIIQEICGYYFLLFDNWKMQFLILLIKSGSAPFYFWLFSIISGLKKWFVFWFLILQKLPYFPVLINFCGDFFFCFLVSGMFMCYFHIFFLRDFVDLLVISSTESFSWLLLYGIFFSDIYFFFIFYYFVMFFVISYIYGNYMNFVNLEMIFVFFNVPLSITFFLKVFLLFGSSFFIGYYYYYLLLVMPLMSLGVGYFFFLVSMLCNSFGLKYYDYLICFVFCFGLLCVF